ncbi:MAG: MFS transporter [Promethearchaeota archaeon]
MTTPNSLEIRTNWRNIVLWTTYDSGNTVFSMGIVSMTVLQYFELLGMQSGHSFGFSHFIGSTAVSISNVIVAIAMPFLGAYSDRAGSRKPFVILFGSLCILFTGAVFIFTNFLLGIVLFIAANVTYQWGNLFYDAMLPYISNKREIGRVSSLGIAIGYFGSLAALVLAYFFSEAIFGEHTDPDDVGETVAKADIVLGDLQGMWILSAIGFLLIAIPFLLCHEQTQERKVSFRVLFSDSVHELLDTAKEIRRYPDMLKFIIAYFIISDAVNTVILVMKDVGQNALDMGTSEVLILLGIGVVASIFVTYFYGPIVDKKGPKFTWLAVVGPAWLFALWCFLVADLGLMPKAVIYIGAFAVGSSMGGTWVVGRQYVIELAPSDKVAQYFGFQKLAGKVSASIGPILFSAALNLGFFLGFNTWHAYRLAIFSLFLFFIVGYLIFIIIKDYHPNYLQGERGPFIYNKEE